MTILLVSPLPPPAGGIATWTVMYQQYCQKHAIPLRIVNNALQGTRASKMQKKIRILDELKRANYILCNFRKALKQEQPDIVHINTSCSKFGILRDYLCVRYAKRHHIPVVLQCHCNIEDQLKGKLAEKAFQKAANASASVWVLNHASAEFTTKRTDAEIKIIPNFIGEDRIFARENVRETIRQAVFVGHVRKEKGIIEIYETARQFPQISFVVVGPVQEDIAAMQRPDNIHLTGAQPPEKVQQYLCESDVFLFPSHTEGFANALLEAMANGLPVIATDVGANREMLENSGGVIIPVGSGDLLCEALGKMNSMPEFRRQASEWNQNKVRQNYTINVVLENIIGQYEEVVKSTT